VCIFRGGSHLWLFDGAARRRFKRWRERVPDTSGGSREEEFVAREGEGFHLLLGSERERTKSIWWRRRRRRRRRRFFS